MSKTIITVAKKVIGGLLSIGDHIVEIVECGLELSKEQDNWSDRTPQLKVVAKNKTGQITAWMNLRGYKNASDFEGGIAPKGFEFRSYDENSEKFLVDKKTGKRVESPERTAKLLENVGNLAYAAGIKSEELDLDDLQDELQGASVAVRVRENSKGNREAYYFMQPDEASVTA